MGGWFCIAIFLLIFTFFTCKPTPPPGGNHSKHHLQDNLQKNSLSDRESEKICKKYGSIWKYPCKIPSLPCSPCRIAQTKSICPITRTGPIARIAPLPSCAPGWPSSRAACCLSFIISKSYGNYIFYTKIIYRPSVCFTPPYHSKNIMLLIIKSYVNLYPLHSCPPCQRPTLDRLSSSECLDSRPVSLPPCIPLKRLLRYPVAVYAVSGAP